MNHIKTRIFQINFLVILLFISNLSIAQDYSYDKQIGAESAIQVEQTIGIYNDSALTSYVQAVGQRLVGALGESPFTFQFHVVDMAEPNAFALPGGYIYISRGLLSLVNDEAELACVMGHEMIHVTKRHAIKQMKKSIFPCILHIPGAVVGMFNSNLGNIINAPVSLGSELFLKNYSRKQESEADKLGIKLASIAGYNPEKLAIILERLSTDVEHLTGESEKRSYFSSHPYTPKRVENIEKEIAELQWTEKAAIAPDTKSLYEKIAGMVYGPNPAQGIFDSTFFMHPDLNLSITFPDGWKTINVPVAVGAVQKDGEARLVYMINDSVVEPDTIGKAFADYLKKEYKLKPDQNQSIDINGFPAYVVSITDATGQQPV
ncbi:MAG: M48 family metalloprotease [Bacteroidales bacterium]